MQILVTYRQIPSLIYRYPAGGFCEGVPIERALHSESYAVILAQHSKQAKPPVP